MASDMYVQVDGLKGESTDGDHKDWIEIQSYAHEIKQNASSTVNSAGGGTVGRTQHGDLTIKRHQDLASPKFHEMCSSGAHIKKVAIELMRASGGSRVKYMAIEMDQVVVSSVKTEPSDDLGLPIETVAFNYGTIKWTYTQQKRADGSKGGNVTGGWDLTANKVAS